MATFEPGELVLHRAFVDERLVFLKVGRVIEHDEDGLRLWFAYGTPMAISLTAQGLGIRDMPYADWLNQVEVLTVGVRRAPELLMYIPPKAAHSVWWFWDQRGTFHGWYVNLEEPSVLWRDGDLIGVDTTDQDLDVWVYPDRSWEWKDEDEFEERSAYPDHYWVREPGAVRAEGERLIGLVEAGAFPFDGRWCDFRPDPGWAWPTDLPAGWDRPRVR